MEIISYIVAVFLGYVLACAKNNPPSPVSEQETLNELRKEIEYYKKLCSWHVEEKKKLTNHRNN